MKATQLPLFEKETTSHVNDEFRKYSLKMHERWQKASKDAILTLFCLHPRGSHKQKLARKKQRERNLNRPMGFPTPWHEVEQMFPDIVEAIDQRIYMKDVNVAKRTKAALEKLKEKDKFYEK